MIPDLTVLIHHILSLCTSLPVTEQRERCASNQLTGCVYACSGIKVCLWFLLCVCVCCYRLCFQTRQDCSFRRIFCSIMCTGQILIDILITDVHKRLRCYYFFSFSTTNWLAFLFTLSSSNLIVIDLNSSPSCFWFTQFLSPSSNVSLSRRRRQAGPH